jgi:hypothetical protein
VAERDAAKTNFRVAVTEYKHYVKELQKELADVKKERDTAKTECERLLEELAKTESLLAAEWAKNSK